MEKTLFGYRCPECENGEVEENIISSYETKIKGYSFTVQNAKIGICNECDSKHFSAKEVENWEQQFEKSYSLSPEEIKELREALGLSIEHFSFLIGCTRQSLYNWENPERKISQNRMADVLMKLVRESLNQEKIDVLGFLLQQANLLGVQINISKKPGQPIELYLEKKYEETVNEEMAANSNEKEQMIILVNEEGKESGKIYYDFDAAAIFIESCYIPLFSYIRIYYRDGTQKESNIIKKNRNFVLVDKVRQTEMEKIEKVVLFPNKNNKDDTYGNTD